MMKNVLLTIYLFAIGVTLNAQTINGNVDIEEPSTSNSSKGQSGGDLINVDEFTGTASVNIPLYNYSVDNLNLGVSLGYVAKGIKVDELASPVGLGWGLNGGGYITRQISGIEDEVTMPVYYRSDPSYPNDSLQGRLVPGAQPYNEINLTFNDDQEYDLFNFNAGGLSFSFAMNEAGQILTYPKRNVKIEIITKDSLGNGFTNIRKGIQNKTGLSDNVDIMTFMVTDESGNIFYFERGDHSKKWVRGHYNVDSAEYYGTSSWILDRIVTCTGKQIKYYYTHKKLEYVADITQTLTNNDPAWDGYDITYDPLEIREQKFDGESFHLNRIEYPDGTKVYLDLGSETNDRCDCQGNYVVKKIRITKENGVEGTSNQLEFKLNYAYFNSNNYGQSIHPEIAYPTPCSTIASSLDIPSGENVDSAKAMHLSRGLRLKLKSIERIGTDGTTTEPYYSFTYNAVRLPYRFSPGKDYYGYFNNATCIPYVRKNIRYEFAGGPYPNETFYLSIPYHVDQDTPGKYWGVDKSFNFTYAQAAVLTKIANGLGGTKELRYQDYQLSNPDSAYGYINGIGYTIDSDLEGDTVNDGLCIWRVVTTDALSSGHGGITEYELFKGERFNRGGYSWYPAGGGFKVYTNYFVGQNSLINGSNHGFSEVAVTSTGDQGEFISSTRTYYSNLMYYDDNGDHVSCMHKPSGLAYHVTPGNLKQYRMGLVKKTENYDEYGVLKTKTENNYGYYSYAPIITNVRPVGGGIPWEFELANHEMMRVVNRVVNRYIYDPAISSTKTMSTTYDYEYNDSNHIKGYKWTDSRDEVFKKYCLYNYDYRALFGYPSVLDSMNKHHMYHLISEEVWKMNGSDSVLLNYTLSVPKLSTPDNVLTFPAGFQSIAKNPISSSSAPTSVNRGNALNYGSYSSYGINLEKSKEFLAYDAAGNILETRNGNKDLYQSSIWDIYTGDKLADVSNARYNDIAYTSFEGIYQSQGISDYNKGNWDFDAGDIFHKDNSSTNAITGNYILDIKGANKSIEGKPLRHKRYILSFWLNAFSDVTVSLERPGNSQPVTCTVQNQVGDWKLYTANILPDSGAKVMIYGVPNPITPPPNNYAYIDEIRLHPANALMSSYTINPMFGISSMTNADNTIAYVEYDVFGRKTILRDMRGFILKKYETHYQDLDGASPGTGTGGGGTPGSD